MRNEHVDELIDLYALGALEAGEQQAVDEHLDECARCRAQLEEAKRLVLLLAWTPDQHDPPPALQQKVMRRVQQLQRLEGRAPQKWWQNLDLRRWLPAPQPALGWASALALVLALVLGGRTVQLQRRLETAQGQIAQQQQQVAALEQQLAEQQPVADLLRVPGTRLVTLTARDDPSQIQGYLLLRPDAREAFVTTAALTPLPADQTYQLWLIGEGAESVGTFALDAQGVGTIAVEAARPLSQYQAIGITVEPAGGSPQPTSDPIVLTNL